MSVKLTTEEVRNLAETLQGTCLSFEQGLKMIGHEDVEQDDITLESLKELDDQVFLCSMCGWWCSQDELSENHDEEVCTECAGDEE